MMSHLIKPEIQVLLRQWSTIIVIDNDYHMVDATGMCGACTVPYHEDGKLVRKHGY